MKHQARLSREQQLHSAEQQSRQQTIHDFATAEEVLRYDAAQTQVPPAIAKKLQKSLERAGAPSRSWWKNLFGK